MFCLQESGVLALNLTYSGRKKPERVSSYNFTIIDRQTLRWFPST